MFIQLIQYILTKFECNIIKFIHREKNMYFKELFIFERDHSSYL